MLNTKNNRGFGAEITNSIWLISEKIIKLIGQLLVGVVLARQLGVELFGQLNYLISYVYIFFSLSTLAMDNLLIKFIVERPSKLNQIISSALLLRVFTGIFFFIVSYLLGIYFFFIDFTTSAYLAFIVILFQILFQPFDVFRLYFQSKLKSHLPSLALTFGYIVGASVRIYFCFDLNFKMIVFSYVLEVFIYSLIITYFFKTKNDDGFRFSPSSIFLRELFVKSLPLLASNFFYLIYVKADQIMLGKLSSQTELAYFSVASRLSESWYFIPVAIVNSVYPSFISLKNSDKELYRNKIRRTLSLLSTISISIALVTSLLSYPLIKFLYGVDYVQSAFILNIHIWTGVIVFSGVLSGAWMTNHGLDKITAVRTLFGAILNIILNYVLIKSYGAVGVAIATLITRFMVSYLFNAINSNTREIFALQTQGLFDALKLKGFKTVVQFIKSRKIS